MSVLRPPALLFCALLPVLLGAGWGCGGRRLAVATLEPTGAVPSGLVETPPVAPAALPLDGELLALQMAAAHPTARLSDRQAFATALFQAGYHAAAVAEAEAAAARFSKSVDAWGTLGVLEHAWARSLTNDGAESAAIDVHLEGARVAFERVHQFDPARSVVMRSLADIADRQGDSETAARWRALQSAR